jgi:alkaline phosphatase
MVNTPLQPLFAFGPGSAELGGLKDNTDIGKKLIQYVTGNP